MEKIIGRIDKHILNARGWWLSTIILAMQEADIRRIIV
jgi:hypothetical protein